MRQQTGKLGRRASLKQDARHARLDDPAPPHDEHLIKAIAEDMLNLMRDHNHCPVLKMLIDQSVDFSSSGRVQAVAKDSR